MAAKRSSASRQSLLNFLVAKKVSRRVDNVETIEQEQDPSVDKSGGISTENKEQTQESMSTAISTEDRSLTFCQADCCRLDRTEPYQPIERKSLENKADSGPGI